VITVRQRRERIVECSRPGTPTVYLLDTATYAAIARIPDEDTRWRLIEQRCLARKEET
jgi:hypothetical protein